MIRLITGLPGSFKTCYVVGEIRKAIAAGRPVYVSNLNGANVPGMMILEDPRKWEELPAGALLVVDEAQRFWRSSRSLEVPPEVQAMETHRHLGIDFLLTTQQPTYLLKHLRGLVGSHVHHLARTKSTAQTWTWNSCNDDTESLSQRDLAEGGLYMADPENFRYYISTEKDTHKRKIPRKWLFIGGAALVVLALFLFLPGQLTKAAGTGDRTTASATDGASAQPPPQGRASLRAPPTTLAAYVDWLTPRIDGAPWSAPAYDDRKVVSKPEVYCIASGAGLDGAGQHRPPSFTCLTEQGTTVVVEPARARRIARQGSIYNPYREPVDQRDRYRDRGDPDSGAGRRPAETGGPAAASTGTGEPFGSVASYGQLGVSGSNP